MRARRRQLLPNFEACSLALFTALALGTAGTARAQAAPVRPSTLLSAPGTAGAGVTRTAAAADIPANAWTRQQIADAFREADKDGDGRISRGESRIWTGFSRQFEQFDRDRDGGVSWPEFDESLK